MRLLRAEERGMNDMGKTNAGNADPVFWEKARAHLIRYGGDFAPIIAERAQGSFMWDAGGRRILDFCSGQMSAIIGHSHPEIVEVVRHTMGELDHLYSTILSRPVVELAALLAATVARQARSRAADLHRRGIQRGRHPHGQAGVRTARDCRPVALVAWRHGWAASATYSSSRRGYGPTQSGSFVLPAPDPYRSRFIGADGVYDWSRSSTSASSWSIGSQRVPWLRASPSRSELRRRAGAAYGYMLALAAKCRNAACC
jgi:2,2-dialkylglycine decarboxylase (pyruvate)